MCFQDPTVLQDHNLQLYSLILFRQRTSRMEVEGPGQALHGDREANDLECASNVAATPVLQNKDWWLGQC